MFIIFFLNISYVDINQLRVLLLIEFQNVVENNKENIKVQRLKFLSDSSQNKKLTRFTPNSFNFTNSRSNVPVSTSILLSPAVLLSQYIYFIYRDLLIKRLNRDRFYILKCFQARVHNQRAGSERTEINVGLRGR